MVCARTYETGWKCAYMCLHYSVLFLLYQLSVRGCLGQWEKRPLAEQRQRGEARECGKKGLSDARLYFLQMIIRAGNLNISLVRTQNTSPKRKFFALQCILNCILSLLFIALVVIASSSKWPLSSCSAHSSTSFICYLHKVFCFSSGVK